MALEDAFVLARCLSEDAELRQALARYEALRRPRCARIVQAANDNATNYHLRPGPMRFAAHTARARRAVFAPAPGDRRFDWGAPHRRDRGLKRAGVAPLEMRTPPIPSGGSPLAPVKVQRIRPANPFVGLRQISTRMPKSS